MEIRNCKQCGRLYNYYLGQNLCPGCVQKLDDKFQEVKEYIYDHQGAGISEVSEACDVSVNQIKQWVREERLEFTVGSVTGLNCEGCGQPIHTGRFCKNCKNQMIQGFESAYPEKTKENEVKESANAKMRFFK